MIARYFIARPVLACVCAAFIVLAGLAALRQLPRTQWPNVQPRIVNISAYYPDANAETAAAVIAAPLEQQLGNVPHLLYTRTTASANGYVGIEATFDLSADLTAAVNDINARMQRALPLLPEEARRHGVSVEQRANNNLMVVTLQSPDRRFDLPYLSNYARLHVSDELQRLPGVAEVVTSSARYYSLRIWLQPDKLARLQLTPLDVLRAVREQNSQYTAGRIGDAPLAEPVDFTFTVNLPSRLSKPEEFEQIVLRAAADGVVRLKDVARVELGAASYETTSKLNGEWALPLSINVLNSANSLATAELVRARLQELSAAFPAGLTYAITYDSTIHVRQAIREVTLTLFEALLLVFAVVFVFTGGWRATLIPMLAVPVSIIGVFVIMLGMHFTLNTVTLFGMVFAIGIVVDDAIIVIENVQRIMQTQHLDVRAATEQAMREVTRPVMAIVLVLVAVFMPVAFMSGIAGTLYQQFAVTIAGSVTISGIVALTLTPALCVQLLRSSDAEHGNPGGFHRRFAAFADSYVKGVAWLAKHGMLAVAAPVVMAAAIYWLALRTPTTLVPKEDRSIVYAAPVLQDAASLSRAQAVVDAIAEGARKHPAVQDVVEFAGIDGVGGGLKPSGGELWIILKPWAERRSAGMAPSDVVDYIEGYSAKHIQDAVVYAFEPAPITGGSRAGEFEGYIQARVTDDPHELAQVTTAFLAAVQRRSEVKGVSTSYRADVPQIRINVDRDKAKTLGVALDELFTTLQSTVGAYYINDFDYAGRVWEVQMQADAPFRARVDDLRNIFVRSASGVMVPLTALTSTREVTGPETVERYNSFNAARVFGRVAPGAGSSAAHKAMEEVAREVLPPGYVLSWSGTSYQQRVVGQSVTQAVLLAVLMVFLILAAQYERWSLPLAVILGVPFAVLGAFLAVWVRGLDNDIFFQIGLVTLVGLSAKNGILIVEYASQLQSQGKSSLDAALQAARLRFRPIVMTSVAFVFGVLPLAFATGAGANARHSIATGVIGGMLAATFIATLFIPLFYVWIAGRGSRAVAPR